MLLTVHLEILSIYAIILGLFSSIYYYLGCDHITFSEKNVVDAIYFSTTIQATIGFGDITPKSKLAKIIVIVHQNIVIFVNTMALFSIYKATL